MNGQYDIIIIIKSSITWYLVWYQVKYSIRCILGLCSLIKGLLISRWETSLGWILHYQKEERSTDCVLVLCKMNLSAPASLCQCVYVSLKHSWLCRRRPNQPYSHTALSYIKQIWLFQTLLLREIQKSYLNVLERVSNSLWLSVFGFIRLA